MIVLRAVFSSGADFLSAYESEIAKGGLLVRGASANSAEAMSACTLEVQIASDPPVGVPAKVAAVVPGHGVAVLFDKPPQELAALAQKLRAPAEPDESAPEAGSIVERLRAMSMPQKTQLALSGNRDERLALFRDQASKPAHLFVLKNPRIGLDEVQYAAKLSSLSPDALKYIAEHRDWGANAGICTALVRNPKTPIPLALRALEKVPVNEIRAIAKGGAREQLVHAARKKLSA